MTNVADNSCQLCYRGSSADERGGEKGYTVFECFKHICICINSRRFIECYKIL